MNLYVDCGAHKGKTVENWAVGHPADKVYAFEPNPAPLRHARWAHILQHLPQVVLLQRAVWITDTTLDFYRNGQEPDSQSGTLMQGKRFDEKTRKGAVDYEMPVPVQAIDFSRWLRELIRPGDHVTVKMDIEGAEYQVLAHLVAQGTARLVNKLIIEFHCNKFVDAEMRALDAIVRVDLLSAGVELEVLPH